MIRTLRFALAAALLAFASPPAGAHTFDEVEKTCPLDGKPFKAVMDMSGTSFGMQLDLKPLGPTPAPWRLAVCPRDGFVLLKENLSPAEIADYRAFVATAEYKKWAAAETSYFLAAQLLDHGRADTLSVAHVLLKATWQVDHEPERYARYAAAALDKFNMYLAKAAPKGKDWQTAQLVALELERRLSRFDAAAARIAELKKKPEMTAGLLGSVLGQEEKLVAARDAAPHPLASGDEKKAKPGAR